MKKYGTLFFGLACLMAFNFANAEGRSTHNASVEITDQYGRKAIITGYGGSHSDALSDAYYRADKDLRNNRRSGSVTSTFDSRGLKTGNSHREGSDRAYHMDAQASRSSYGIK